MRKPVASAIDICPFFFKDFNAIYGKIKNFEATAVYIKIQFHQLNSKITKRGEVCIVRSREQLAQWFGFKQKKMDRLLKILEEKNLITKQSGLWYCQKRLFITAHSDTTKIPINIRLLETLMQATGSLKNAIIYSKILFVFNKFTVLHEGLSWCCITKQNLADWSGLSIRHIDDVLDELLNKKLLLKKNFVQDERVKTHFHIPQRVIEKIHSEYQGQSLKQALPIQTKSTLTEQSAVFTEHQKENGAVISASATPEASALPLNLVLPDHQTVKFVVPLKGNAVKTVLPATNHPIASILGAAPSIDITQISKQKEPAPPFLSSNIVNVLPPKKPNTTKNAHKNDSHLSKIQDKLTPRQEQYLKGAIKNVIARSKIKISSPAELYEEIKFSILSSLQRKRVETFQHAVSRCMKILADNNWRTPKGFYKYSAAGAEINQLNQHRLDSWQQQKEAECMSAKNESANLAREMEKLRLTEQAIQIAEKMVKLPEPTTLEDPAHQRLVDNMMRSIQDLASRGADLDLVGIYLRNNL